ncbi:pggt1b [Trichonephila clavipes]|nr:pggt1b [Trichonephila clavipes]
MVSKREPFPIPTLNTPRFLYINPFAFTGKSTVAPVVFQRVSPTTAVSIVVFRPSTLMVRNVQITWLWSRDCKDIMHGYRLDTSCSIFTAEAVAIYRALQLIDSTMPRKYCIYTDSMSVLEALENYHDRCHPVVCTILRHYE